MRAADQAPLWAPEGRAAPSRGFPASLAILFSRHLRGGESRAGDCRQEVSRDGVRERTKGGKETARKKPQGGREKENERGGQGREREVEKKQKRERRQAEKMGSMSKGREEGWPKGLSSRTSAAPTQSRKEAPHLIATSDSARSRQRGSGQSELGCRACALHLGKGSVVAQPTRLHRSSHPRGASMPTRTSGPTPLLASSF